MFHCVPGVPRAKMERLLLTQVNWLIINVFHGIKNTKHGSVDYQYVTNSKK